MLQLQLKNLVVPKLSKKITFFIRLSFFCIAGHASLLLLLFVLQDFKKKLVIDTLNPDVAVVFVPLLKTPILIKPTAPLPAQKAEPHTAIATPVHKKSNTEKTTRTVADAKKVVPKAVQKNSKTTTIKKPEIKKTVQKKTVPKVQEKKVVPPKQLENKKPEVAKHEAIKQGAPSQATLLVGNEERDMFMLQEGLKKNILQQWKRPSNIPDNCVCHLKVILNKDGSREIIIEKSSHAMALDMSARNFLLQYNFPEQLYGKELSIIF